MKAISFRIFLFLATPIIVVSEASRDASTVILDSAMHKRCPVTSFSVNVTTPSDTFEVISSKFVRTRIPIVMFMGTGQSARPEPIIMTNSSLANSLICGGLSFSHTVTLTVTLTVTVSHRHTHSQTEARRTAPKDSPPQFRVRP